MRKLKHPSLLVKMGNQLRRLRLENEKTAKEISYILGITTQAYGNIERGKAGICITKLVMLAAYYKIQFEELLPEEFRCFDTLQNMFNIDTIPGL